MIINSKADFDAAPKAEQDRFLLFAAHGTKRWEWDGAKWELKNDYAAIESFGLSAADLPKVDDPPMPDYNPDERAREQLAEQVKEQRDRMLRNTDYAVIADSPHDTQEMREYRQALRDVPQQSGFPESVVWPT